MYKEVVMISKRYSTNCAKNSHVGSLVTILIISIKSVLPFSKLFGKSQVFPCVQRVFAQSYAITWQEGHICPVLEIGLGPPTAESKSLKNYANFDLGDLVLRSPALWSS